MLKRLRNLFSLSLLLVLPAFAVGQNVVRVSNSDLVAGQNYTWTNANVYVLDDMVFVKPGSKLFIGPGTVVKAALGEGNNATGLVVTRGAQIFAEGTASEPIIMTSEVDELNGNLTSDDRGLWGGLVILGAAGTNNQTPGGVRLIEGVNEIADPVSYAEYGGNNDDDDSGVLRYISIRHSGINVGDVAGNEIQGLTLGGVGRGTLIEYVEVFASNDDGFEWFGGTVDGRYLVSAFNTDDAFDWDEGFRGRGQFWFAIQDAYIPDEGYGRGMELDGAIGDEKGTPFAIPTLSNITVLGGGTGARPNAGDGSQLVIIRDNSGGKFYNSIFGDGAFFALTVEDVGSEAEFDSRRRLENGDIVFQNNLFWGFGNGNTASDMFPQEFVRTNLTAASNDNRLSNFNLRGISRTPNGGLDPRPASGSPALDAASVQTLNDDWFYRTTYTGAFGNRNWAKGWTVLDQLGYLAEDSNQTNVVNVQDNDFDQQGDYYWTSNNTYILDDMVFIKPGSRLFIEAGTVVKGALGEGNNATGLVITKGAQIFAEGTADNPIIFTSEIDELNGNLTSDDRGLWGGVVVLGAAGTNNQTPGGVRLIEGVNEIADPSTLAEYGGNNDDDDSGVLRYISIRHSGINVGDVAGNEIQGLTLGGVGRGTLIEYVEVFASNDDGFEWFGGTVDGKFLVSAFNTDDAFDWDEGFRGRGQFWFAIQDPYAADEGYGRGMELDGAIGDEKGTPFAIPTLSNITILGAGTGARPNAGDGSQLVILRDNSGGKFYNSIFGDGAFFAVTVEDVANESEFDSRRRLETNDIVMKNNIFYGFGNGNTPEAMFPQEFVRTYMTNQSNANRFVDFNLRGISRTTNGNLDPRPGLGSPAWGGASAMSDNWFENTTYVGAFGSRNWMSGWTKLDADGYLNTGFITSDASDEVGLPSQFTLEQNYPNPFNPSTVISFNLPVASDVQLTVYDMLGRKVSTLVNSKLQAGTQTIQFNASNLASGIYLYELKAGSVRLTQKMTLIK